MNTSENPYQQTKVTQTENCNFPVFLPPATKLEQGNVFTGVCDSVHGGGCLHQAPPPKQTPPGEQTPPRDQTHLLQSRHPPGPDTPPPPGTATAAGGTHPTVMHSCYNLGLNALVILEPIGSMLLLGGGRGIISFEIRG